VVEDPSPDPVVMTADEADLWGIRMLEAASKARENARNGERAISQLPKIGLARSRRPVGADPDRKRRVQRWMPDLGTWDRLYG
jgi:hypothetical protein